MSQHMQFIPRQPLPTQAVADRIGADKWLVEVWSEFAILRRQYVIEGKPTEKEAAFAAIDKYNEEVNR